MSYTIVSTILMIKGVENVSTMRSQQKVMYIENTIFTVFIACICIL